MLKCLRRIRRLFKPEWWLKLPALVFTGLLLLLLLSIAYGSWPLADDFCNMVVVKEKGWMGALVHLYWNWSGRLVDSALLYAIMGAVPVQAMPVVSMVLAGCWVILCWSLARWLSDAHQILTWPLTALLLSALTWGCWLLINQTVFWPTGGVVYLLPPLLGIAWLKGFQRTLVQMAPSNLWRAWGLRGLSLAAGNSMELMLPILVIPALVLVWQQRRSNLAGGKEAFVQLVLLTLGAIILLAAPGNLVRGTATAGSFNFAPLYLLTSFWSILVDLLQKAWPIFLFACVAGALSFGLAWHHKYLAQASFSMALCLGGICSILPMLAAPAQYAPRNGFYLLIFVLTASLWPSIKVLRHMSAEAQYLAATLMLLVTASICSILVPKLHEEIRATHEFQQQQLKRHAQLMDLSVRGITVIARVDPIHLPPPVTMHMIEISGNPQRWDNKCVAKYYGLNGVALKLE